MPETQPLATPRHSRIKLIAAVALAAAAIFDWTRPPERQVSVPLYEHVVIWPYRTLMRPATSHFIQCRFKPTCSEYSVEAVREYGFPIGAWMTTKRLFRCMPGVPLGTPDPVPPRHAS